MSNTDDNDRRRGWLAPRQRFELWRVHSYFDPRPQWRNVDLRQFGLRERRGHERRTHYRCTVAPGWRAG
jgi:hypothetical protein